MANYNSISNENEVKKMNVKKETKIIGKIENESKEGNICLYSYNSRGFDIIKQQFCMELINIDKNSTPILCNQENFVLKGNGHLIRRAIPNFHVFIKPAKKDHLDGRPINGMFIAIPENLRNKAKDISPNNDRVQAILLDANQSKLMIINVYFPQDPKTKVYNLDSDFEDVLATLESLTDNYQCNNVLIVGDLNADYKRDNGRVKRLDTFLSNNNLEVAWNSYVVDYTHEFEVKDTTYTSTIDHVLWSSNMSKNILDAGVSHHPSNTSDHSPIYCRIKNTCAAGAQVPLQEKGDNKSVNTKVLEEDDWDRYSTKLDQTLQLVKVPDCIHCRDIHCKNENHTVELDEYVTNVLEAVDNNIKTVTKTKRTNVGKAKVIPGWADTVKPVRDDAMFWSAVWKSAGRPMNTTLHQLMKKTRNLYHYAIRKCKRATESIKKDKLLNSCLAGKNNIFDEIRKMRRVKSNAPSSIDGNDQPAKRFAEVYETLYNSTNDTGMTKLMLDKVEREIDDKSLQDVDLVTLEVIEEVVKEIRPNKNDPVFSFNSDCIKRAPTSLFQHLANFIKSFLIHGHVSNILLVATIIPLIKNKLGDMECSDNYRSIALSSVVLKIFDWIVTTLFGKLLKLDELQFSYQKNCSTTMCTWLVIESVSYFSRNGSDVFACFMDMKKAFDMVKHSSLFEKLAERKLPPIYLRLLLVMYMTQTAKVKWEGTVSDAFSVLNGVKQGAVLSAILFCIYIDDLLKELRRNRDGCWINGSFVGIIVYADDIALLSPSVDGLQNMINTCSRYAKSHNLAFSTHENPKKSKTKCLAFQRKKKDIRKMTLNDKELPWVNSVKHLGSTITDNKACRMNQDLLEKRAAHISNNNELMQEFHYAHPKTKIWVNHVYNTCYYGSPLWDMFSRDFEKLEKSWNVSNRIMLSLPRTAHRYFIEPISGKPHIIKSLKKRFVNFVMKIRNSKKPVLRNVLSVIQNDCQSTTGRNIRKLKLLTNNGADDINSTPYNQPPAGSHWRLELVKEILAIKYGELQLENLTFTNLDDIINFVSST